MSLDTVMHPVTKCVIFLEDLLANMVAKKSKDPFGTIRVARKALSKIRELQRGVPPPYGEAFSKETLIRSASSKAFAATTEARIGHWAQGTLQQAYLEKNRLSALVAFAIAGGWDQTSFMRRHFYGRALVSVPEQWIDSLYPGARRLLEDVKMRNARLQSGKRQADDKISDRAAEGFLQTVLYSGICFGRICHSGHRVGDPEAVARMIAEKISAKNISLDAGHASEDLGEILALPPPAAKQDVILPDMPADAKRLKANLIHCMIPAAASTLYRWPGKSGTLAQHRPP
ncbi:hypothetical protein WJX77_010224 [Trebouxia sp. C0004]